MEKTIKQILDLIFPRREIEKILDNLTIQDIDQKCKKNTKRIQGIFSIFCYKNLLIKEMIWQLKYKGQKRHAQTFGYFLAKEISEKADVRNSILIPIPIHTKRRKERGYNQCEWLCEEIIKQKPELVYDKTSLIRTKHNIRQSWSNRKDRSNNIRNVFRLKTPENIRRKNIILIDDVVTTGATLNEVRQLLKKAGANKILSFTIAH